MYFLDEDLDKPEFDEKEINIDDDMEMYSSYLHRKVREHFYSKYTCCACKVQVFLLLMLRTN